MPLCLYPYSVLCGLEEVILILVSLRILKTFWGVIIIPEMALPSLTQLSRLSRFWFIYNSSSLSILKPYWIWSRSLNVPCFFPTERTLHGPGMNLWLPLNSCAFHLVNSYSSLRPQFECHFSKKILPNPILMFTQLVWFLLTDPHCTLYLCVIAFHTNTSIFKSGD